MNHLWPFLQQRRTIPRHLQAPTNLHSYSHTRSLERCSVQVFPGPCSCWQEERSLRQRAVVIQAGGSSQSRDRRSHVWCHLRSRGRGSEAEALPLPGHKFWQLLGLNCYCTCSRKQKAHIPRFGISKYDLKYTAFSYYFSPRTHNVDLNMCVYSTVRDIPTVTGERDTLKEWAQQHRLVGL